MRIERARSRGVRHRASVTLLVVLALLATGCGVGDPDAVVIGSERASTTGRATTSEGSPDPGGPASTESPTTDGGSSGSPETSDATIPDDDFGCPASGTTSLFPCDDDDPSDQVWHVGSCLDFDAAANAYGERPCAGASAFIKELAEPFAGDPAECFFDHIDSVALTDEELASSGGSGGSAEPGSLWCVSSP